MNILQLSCHFRPNVGGVETHLNDLVTELVRKKHNVFVLTYRPLMSDAKWKILEKQKGLTIFRIPWIKGYFYKLVKSPIVEFMYLLPGLFIVLPFVLFIKKFDVIHSHGLVAGFVGMFWGKVFDIKTVVSTHSVYEFPKNGLYPFFVKWMFNSTDKVLTLSKQSKKELVGLGVDEKKIGVFTYWVDLDRFKVTGNKLQAKKKLAHNITSQFRGSKRADEAQNDFEKTVQKRSFPENIQLAIFSENKITVLKLSNIFGRSNSENKRLIKQGGVELNGKKTSNPNQIVEIKDGDIIKFGKREFRKVKITYFR